MLSLKLRLSPIRMVMGQKHPLIVDAIIKNNSNISILSTIRVVLPPMFGFDSSGLVRDNRKRIGFIKAGMEKTIPFRIIPKPMIKEGEYTIRAEVIEHETDRYDKVKSIEHASTELRVIK